MAMPLIPALGLLRKLPVILQSEATECGLACLAMVAAYHGHHTDLSSLRRRFPISLKGATLASLIHVANDLQLVSRPVKLDIDKLHLLRCPCILHWNFNHFVVLKSVSADGAVIHDPAIGVLKAPLKAIDRSFTGVALELWPASNFNLADNRTRIRLRDLMGSVRGLRSSLMQIIVLAFVIELLALIAPFYLQWVIDNVIVSSDSDLLTVLALGFGLLVITQHVIVAARSWSLLYFGTSLNLQWRANVFAHLLKLPVTFFEKRHLGDIVSRFSSIDAIQRTLTTSFLETLIDGIMAVITLVMMVIYSPALTAVALGAMALYILIRIACYLPLRNASEHQIVHAAKQNSHFLETIRGIKAIKLFRRLDERRSSWLSFLAEQINAEVTVQKIHMVAKLAHGVLFGIENIIIIWLGAKNVLAGGFTVGAFIAFHAYKSQFAARVAALVEKLLDIRMLRLQAERLSDIVYCEAEKPGSALAKQEFLTIIPSIEVQALQFRYGAHEPMVLDRVSFRINEGESVAIVGPSGCGKTTLLNVLLGILPVTSGEVLIGGINLRTLGIDAFREIVGTVLQDDVLFAGSISDNISFFDSNPDVELIHQCADLASIATEIAAMPMGYNTLVGDMGTVLSGGQRQRILLARALYKKPKILFLDEATSHLDIEREQSVNTAIRSLKITRIIIAHRPETIASADRIIVLLNGVIADDFCRASSTNNAELNRCAPESKIVAVE